MNNRARAFAVQRTSLTSPCWGLHGPAYLTTFGDSLSFEQKKALRAITVCRMAALGGHATNAVTAATAWKCAKAVPLCWVEN
jgi:hypothetical protein